MKALSLVLSKAELWDMFGVIVAVSRYPYQKNNPIYGGWVTDFLKYLDYTYTTDSHCIVFKGFEIEHLYKCVNLYIRYRAGRNIRCDDIANYILKGSANHES
jgi:hypothetical protein